MDLLPGIPVSSPIAASRGRPVEVGVGPRLLPAGTTTLPKSGGVKSAAAAVAKQEDSPPATRVVEQELGRDAFLQLLVLQLRNQDPLDPQDNQSMLAQLAQFSALEQQTNLNDSFNTLSGNVDQLNFISAGQLLGRRVSGVDLNGVQREGVVESVHLDGSVVVLRVDGELMSMAGVLRIDVPAPSVDSGSKSRY